MKIYILRRCSGSGKSTYAKNLPGETKICSADNFFMKDGEYKFDRNLLGQAHASCLREFATEVYRATDRDCYYCCGAPGYDNLVVDNTNTTMEDMLPYLMVAKAYGHEPEIMTFMTRPERAHIRNLHNVPLAVVKAQYERLMKTKIPNCWKTRYDMR